MLLRVLVLIVSWKALAIGQDADPELNTLLMEATFRVTGPAKTPNQGTSIGTGFFMGKPIPGSSGGGYVLVTAAHVFEDISGDNATIVLRKKQADNSYKLTPFQIAIRDGDKNLYVKHPDVDVAAILVSNLPAENDITLLGMDFLADEATFVTLRIHPGNNLTALGYPLGATANEWGFAILRSGRISSYPLLPIKTVKTFLFDFRVFGGNSGGPVYLVEPRATFAPPHSIPLGGSIQYIVGLVTQQVYSNTAGNPALDLGVIIPSPFIKETIDMVKFPTDK